MRVIAINGRKRSGKDTVAEYLIDNYPRVERVQFARTLKNLFLSSYNKLHAQSTITYDDVDGATDFDREELIENEVMKPEEVFVDFIYNLSSLVDNKYDGLVEFDSLDAILVANRLIKENEKFSVRMYLEFLGSEIAKVSTPYIWSKLTILETINKDAEVVVIPDLRFEEELQELLECEHLDVTTLKIERDNDAEIRHYSDIGISNHLMDYVITNNGTIVDLYTKIDNILRNEING